MTTQQKSPHTRRNNRPFIITYPSTGNLHTQVVLYLPKAAKRKHIRQAIRDLSIRSMPAGFTIRELP